MKFAMESLEERIEQAFRQINRLVAKNRLMQALKCCEELYYTYPEHPRVLQGMGILRFRCGEPEGEQLLRKAIELKPDDADYHFNMGTMLYKSSRYNDAESSYRKALEITPEHCGALISLASIQIKKNRFREAVQYCEKVLAINPRQESVYDAIGKIMLLSGRIEESLYYRRKSLGFRKSDSVHSCILFALNLQPESTQKIIFNESIAWGKRYADPITIKARPHLNSPLPDRRIRVGYVSGDFKLHPVSYHLKPVLAAHNREQVEVFLYNSFPKTDEMTEELIGYAHRYRDISTLPDEKVEELIRQDGIDILIDLAGHTDANRLLLFARNPAPVQISWIGYFNTTGMKAMDYLLSDAITIPPADDDLFTEEVIRLPDCRFCYSPPVFASEVAPLPAFHRGYVTFGSFNQQFKVNKRTIALWAEVLQAVPRSKMILKCSTFADDGLQAEIRDRFAAHGIEVERLLLRPESSHPKMLAEYADVDIALDTFPFNGGATTCEALWMGVPVVTLEGGTPISRQSKSFLHTIGYPEWVAKKPEDYVQIARQLAGDLEQLDKTRTNLRQRMADSSLCDGKTFARNLEAVYRRIWHKWCAERTQQDISPGMLRRFSIDEIYNSGVICMSDEDHRKAAQLFKYVLRRKPGYSHANNNLGISLFMLGDATGSLKAFRGAIRHNKEFGDAYRNLGHALLELGFFEAARKPCLLAAELMPDNIEALINLGKANTKTGRIEEARLAFEKAHAIEPENLRILGYMSQTALSCGDAATALRLLGRALEIEPDNSELISSILGAMQYDNDTDLEALYRLSVHYGDIVENSYSGQKFVSRDNCVPSSDRKRLRIGFVSSDFLFHPVGRLLAAFFKYFDPTRLALYCYNNSPKNDATSDWYRSTATAWRMITNISDEEVAALIKNNEIDILIDLSGHTDGNRLSLFARRAAPVQVTWMGYGNTTGLSEMDYVIADEDFVTANDERWFTEKVVRLPTNRFCFTPPDPCPEVVEPPCDENGFVTFGSFNNLAKISPAVIAAWAQILLAVPRSRLMLKWSSFNDITLRRRFRDAFARFGVSPRRIEIRRHEPVYYLFMAEYGDMDIALDPFPFTGGMTSLEALWMGVPIVTQTGKLPISRQTASFLKAVDLCDLVGSNNEEYISKAVELARNPGRLKEIRLTLRHRMFQSSLCDGPGFAKSVEKTLFSIWQEASTHM